MGTGSLEMELKKRTICLDQGKMEKKDIVSGHLEGGKKLTEDTFG
tara:strand:- start:584 stop:718 length:135 start_codon:yes stop_codon:yes gene_type:complete